MLGNRISQLLGAGYQLFAIGLKLVVFDRVQPRA
jgi:hypothetical protein